MTDVASESDILCSQFISREEVDQWLAIYDDVTSSFPTRVGKNVSKKERERFQILESTLVYGEIEMKSFALALLKIKYKYGLPNVGYSPPEGVMQQDGGIFVDLGSGTGKAVVAAAIVHNFDTAYGIEILEGLHTLAVDLIATFSSRGKTKLQTIGRDSNTVCNVYHGDMLNLQHKDWRNADVVFANSTCFDEALMIRIADLAQGMKRGAFFITFTRPIPGDDFEVLEFGLHQMSWGCATVYIAQKHTPPR